jgi:hypothetical protein
VPTDAAIRETRSSVILKATFILFFAVCLWLNYPIDPDAHFVISHLAVGALFLLIPFFSLYRPKIAIRKPWGTALDRTIFIGLLCFFALRMTQSVGNQFFFGQASKIILVLMGWLCFKSLDPEGRLLNFFAAVLPVLLAAGMVIGIIVWALSGQIGLERLRIGPNDYEYVSEYAALMLPLILFALDESKQTVRKVFLFAVLLAVLTGLVLTGARGPLIGAIIVVATYSYLARKRINKTVIAVTLGTFALVLLILGSVAYSTGSPSDTNRFSIDDSASLETFTSGRFSNWAFLTDEMLSNNNWIVFGSGLGRLAEWIPSDGGYYRPAVTNGTLSAWVPFGLIGLFGYFYFNTYLWRRLMRTEQGAYRCMALSLFLAYIVTDQVETHWQGTNMLWYVSFVLYVLTLTRPQPFVQKVPRRTKTSAVTALKLSKAES